MSGTLSTCDCQLFASQMHNRRKMKRMSLRQLSCAIGGLVSHEMLARYEKTAAIPRQDVHEALCRVLGIYLPAEYVPLTSLGNVHFRRRYALPKKEQDAILAQAVDYFNLYLEVEHRTGGHIEYRLPFRADEVGDDMEVMADELRRRWNLGFGPLPNISFMLEKKGIKLFESDSVNLDFDGFCATHAGAPLICLAGWLNTNVPRKRMTLAHELGHIVFPGLDEEADSEEEYAIMHFAGAFLVPACTFREAFGDRLRDSVQLGELVELKRYFGASILALMVRAWQLGLVADDAYYRFREFYKSHRYVDREPGEYNIPDHSERYSHMVAQGVLTGVISEQEAALRFRVSRSADMDINVIF